MNGSAISAFHPQGKSPPTPYRKLRPLLAVYVRTRGELWNPPQMAGGPMLCVLSLSQRCSFTILMEGMTLIARGFQREDGSRGAMFVRRLVDVLLNVRSRNAAWHSMLHVGWVRIWVLSTEKEMVRVILLLGSARDTPNYGKRYNKCLCFNVLPVIFYVLVLRTCYIDFNEDYCDFRSNNERGSSRLSLEMNSNTKWSLPNLLFLPLCSLSKKGQHVIRLVYDLSMYFCSLCISRIAIMDFQLLKRRTIPFFACSWFNVLALLSIMLSNQWPMILKLYTDCSIFFYDLTFLVSAKEN